MAFPTGWTLLQKITIDNTKVSGGSNLTDFPVLITEDHIIANTWSSTDDGGGDVRMSSDEAGSNQIPLEVVTFDNSGETCELWTKITLDHDDNTIIYLWGDNTTETQPARADANGSDNVWRSEYKGVYHYETDGSDSTSLQNDLTNTGSATFTTGQIGDGAEFSGTNQYLTRATDTDFDFSGAFTVQQWVEPDGTDANNRFFYRYDTSSKEGYFGGQDNPDTGHYRFLIFTGGGAYKNDLTTGASPASWAKIDMVRNASNVMRVVINGVDDATTTADATVALNPSATLYIGVDLALKNDYDGKMDEQRFINADFGTDWYKTEYNNQNAPATFATGAVVSLIKELSGVAQASIKKVAGVAIASVKKVAGVSN